MQKRHKNKVGRVSGNTGIFRPNNMITITLFQEYNIFGTNIMLT